MIEKVEDILNDTIIKCSGVRSFYFGGDSKNYLTKFASRISSAELEMAYHAILNSNSQTAVQAFVILCCLAHIYLNEGHADKFIVADFGGFLKCTDRFMQERAFALFLLQSYLDFYAKPNRPTFTEYAKKLGLFIGIEEEKQNPEEEVLTIDEVLIRSFNWIRFTLNALEDPNALADYIVSFIHHGSEGADQRTSEDLMTLKSNYPIFLRMMYAKIYAAVLAGSIALENDFQKEFDAHLTSKDYSATGEYEIKLFASYIKALDKEKDIILDDDRIKLVRGIFPLYR